MPTFGKTTCLLGDLCACGDGPRLLAGGPWADMVACRDPDRVRPSWANRC